MKRVNFEYSEEQFKKFKAMCLDLDISLKDLITSLMDDAIKKYEKKIAKTKKVEEPPIADLKFKPKMRKIPFINRN